MRLTGGRVALAIILYELFVVITVIVWLVRTAQSARAPNGDDYFIAVGIPSWSLIALTVPPAILIGIWFWQRGRAAP